MKIVLLSTGRGLRPDFILELRASLGLHDSDKLSLVAWQRSGVPLPLSRHLVIGPHLGVGGRATDQRVQLHALTPAPLEATPAMGGPEPDRAVSHPTGSDTTGPDTSGSDTALSNAALSKAHPLKARPLVLNPRRVVRAVAWRARRLKRSTSRLAAIRRHPRFRRVRGRLSPGISLSFAGNCLQARKVHDLMREADVVVALDTASHRGAWTLAQKVPGPDVVIGVAAARRLLEQRQLSALAEADPTRPSASTS